MAENNSSKSVMDYPEHEKTYALFISISKWVSVASFILLAYLFFFRV